MINGDNDFSKLIINNTNIFENIHPNCITLFGVGLNVAIFYYLFLVENTEENLPIIGGLMFFRWLADCLDGNVARKYKKTSKLGNILDSASDIMLAFIFYLYACTKLKNNTIIIVLTTLCALYAYHAINESKVFESHDKLKQEGGTLSSIQAFMVNNTYVIFILEFLAIKYLMEKDTES
jgi:phosphatidylglycerophosphate synthase